MRERHVTRAAERLYLSQPALSHALKRLRESLDDPLFIRTEKGMQPTPRAQALQPVVQQGKAWRRLRCFHPLIAHAVLRWRRRTILKK